MQLTAGLTGLELTLAGLGVLLTVALLRALFRSRIPKGLKLPPGPRGLPLIGNLLDMPTKQEWVTFSNWAKTYGDIVYLRVLGQDIIILNTWASTYELLEKRSSFYSDRCEFPMLIDLMRTTWSLVIMRYGDVWRRHRKMAHQALHPAASAQYQPVQLKHARAMLQRFQKDPEQYLKHIRHSAGATIMEILYGIKVLPNDDPYIDIAERGMAALGEANPGTYLVDILPILKHVPAWFPGAGFKRQAKIYRKYIVAIKDMPFKAVKDALKSGAAEVSVASLLLEDMTHKKELPFDEEEVIQNTVTTLYAGGADTTVTALHTFMLAMILYPEAQRNAQKELDKVLGPDRLPDFKDREYLPYVDAMAKEVIRWHPVVPLGVVHRVTHDDVLGEYFIPKGAKIFGNVWKILHDPSTYGPNPEQFAPERFLVPGMKEPTPAFGFGRRVCPGRYMAENSVFITIASLLKVFDISPIKDANGREQILEAKFISGLFSAPELFECDIRPRSAVADKLIQQADTS